ncbi:MAG: branched-chain amino acid aminotransferase [Microbacteriaceae bacterium]|nr:branched-chain amino acid aminotransferase [Microbacteriaceae bacterium]
MTHEFKITRASDVCAERRAQALAGDPGFGNFFSDHMVSIVWEKEGGWQTPEILPYGPISLDPSSAVLHYGQEVFEGMKAYRTDAGEIVMFRPEQNAARLNRSAVRLALPQIPEDLFVQACAELVKVDIDWVPTTPGHSLYLRPFLIAYENFLGVRSAHRARFMVIASPAGHYFPDGVKPVSLWLSTKLKRAGHGGTGAAKCGGNYAGSLAATDEAYANGCQQVLFTDAADSDRIDELGGMNFFLVTSDNRLITPEKNGNILEGVTRDSLITLARDRGMNVEERRVTVSEWQEGVKSGEIIEAFACGTAAVIVPVGRLLGPDGFLIEMPEVSESDSVTMQLRTELMGIQFGQRPDPHGWLYPVTS